MANRIGIVAFAFGVPSTIRSNMIIGDIASTMAQQLHAVGVYTQADVNIRGEIEVCRIEEESNNPPPTLRIARGAVKWAAANKINDIYVVAADPHLWRTMRDMRKAAHEAKIILNIWPSSRTSHLKDDSWFCSNSTQERTQSRKNWEKREKILRIMPFWIYKRVAK